MRMPLGWVRLVLVAAMVAVAAAGAGAEPAGAHGTGPAAVPVTHRGAAAALTSTFARTGRAYTGRNCVTTAGFHPGVPVAVTPAMSAAHVHRGTTSLRNGRRRICAPPVTLATVPLVGRVVLADDGSGPRRGDRDHTPVDTS
ncbi:MAG TPA: hypothetical protein VKB69_05350 [Micromonosporaceae bacterium]|nr:hypothetical protein [Micromonosporaceae bacterium]